MLRPPPATPSPLFIASLRHGHEVGGDAVSEVNTIRAAAIGPVWEARPSSRCPNCALIGWSEVSFRDVGSCGTASVCVTDNEICADSERLKRLYCKDRNGRIWKNIHPVRLERCWNKSFILKTSYSQKLNHVFFRGICRERLYQTSHIKNTLAYTWPRAPLTPVSC